MFDPMTLLAAPFESGAVPAPGPRGLVVLRGRASRAFAPETLVCEQSFRPHHDALAAQGVEVTPALDAAAGGFPAAAVVLTRNKAENRANFARAWTLAGEGGTVLAVGAKTDGVESLQRDVKRLIALDGAYPKSHGRVIWGTRSGPTPETFAAWIAEAAPAVRVEDRFVTAAGAFSWMQADPGSRLLAEHLPNLTGAVADLGAGWGYLADAALRRTELERIDLWEAERVALDCARRSIDDPRAKFRWADVAGPELPRGAYDWVISNPPFHEGRDVSVALGQGFLEAGARALRPGGAMMIVANRTLPYEQRLAELFVQVEEAVLTPRYKILRARRPRRARG